MPNIKILVPFDFTGASRKALSVAASVAGAGSMKVTLLHIIHKASDSEVAQQLNQVAEMIHLEHNVECDYQIREGKVITEIESVAGGSDWAFMVIGAHGYKGFVERIHGMDLLRLVKLIPFPVLAVQEDYQFPPNGFRTILLPASSHRDYQAVIDSVISTARLFGSRLIIYSVEKPGFAWPEALRENLKSAMNQIEAAGIVCERVNESQSTYSVGYAKQILHFATKAKADLIAVMSVASDEYHHFADSDKEQLLVNEMQIPVLCASDRKRL